MLMVQNLCCREGKRCVGVGKGIVVVGMTSQGWFADALCTNLPHHVCGLRGCPEADGSIVVDERHINIQVETHLFGLFLLPKVLAWPRSIESTVHQLTSVEDAGRAVEVLLQEDLAAALHKQVIEVGLLRIASTELTKPIVAAIGEVACPGIDECAIQIGHCLVSSCHHNAQFMCFTLGETCARQVFFQQAGCRAICPFMGAETCCACGV